MGKRSRSRSHHKKKHKKHHKSKSSRSRSNSNQRRVIADPARRKSKFSDAPGDGSKFQILQKQVTDQLQPIGQIDALTIGNTEDILKQLATLQNGNQNGGLQEEQRKLFESALGQTSSMNANADILTIKDIGLGGDASSMVNKMILQQANIMPQSEQSEQKKNNDPFQQQYSSLTATGNILNPLDLDASKIKRKIYVPQQNNFNYTGLIIGPKGSNQKRLEEITGCKILVRGKGSQKEGQPPQPDDNEEQHVLIVGDTEAQVAKAHAEIERIIFADEETRNKIRQEQLKMVAQIKNDVISGTTATNIAIGGSGNEMDPSLTTPYGPPSEDAYIIPVPKDCVGLVIGKGGETIRQLQEKSGARRVQVALENAHGSDMRNVFVEGYEESVEKVKKMLQDIVENQKRMKVNTVTGKLRVEVGVPHNMVGLVIGKAGETVRSINQRTGAYVALSREPEHMDRSRKILIIQGTEESIAAAKKEIETIVDGGIKHQQLKLAQATGQMPSMMPMMQSSIDQPETSYNANSSLGQMGGNDYGYGNQQQDYGMGMMGMGGNMMGYLNMTVEGPQIEETVVSNYQQSGRKRKR